MYRRANPVWLRDGLQVSAPKLTFGASFKGKSGMSAESVRPSNSARSQGAGVPEANVAQVLSPLRIAAGSLVLAAASLGPLAVSFAQAPAAKRVTAAKPAAGPAVYAKGEVKRIDPERGVVTLKHGPIEHMGMPDMTMAFHLAHPEQAAGLKVGDQVHFRVEKIAGTLVVVELVASR